MAQQQAAGGTASLEQARGGAEGRRAGDGAAKAGQCQASLPPARPPCRPGSAGRAARARGRPAAADRAVAALARGEEPSEAGPKDCPRRKTSQGLQIAALQLFFSHSCLRERKKAALYLEADAKGCRILTISLPSSPTGWPRPCGGARGGWVARALDASFREGAEKPSLFTPVQKLGPTRGCGSLEGTGAQSCWWWPTAHPNTCPLGRHHIFSGLMVVNVAPRALIGDPSTELGGMGAWFSPTWGLRSCCDPGPCS